MKTFKTFISLWFSNGVTSAVINVGLGVAFVVSGSYALLTRPKESIFLIASVLATFGMMTIAQEAAVAWRKAKKQTSVEKPEVVE